MCKVMHCCCTSISHRSMQFPWYTAGTQHLLSPQHKGKHPYISFRIGMFSFRHCISVLIAQSQKTDWDTDSIHALPLFPSPTLSPLSTIKLTLYHPVMSLPTPCWFYQPRRPRFTINPSMADGTFLCRPKTQFHCWLIVILKPGPSPSSCVIRLLKKTVLES